MLRHRTEDRGDVGVAAIAAVEASTGIGALETFEALEALEALDEGVDEKRAGAGIGVKLVQQHESPQGTGVETGGDDAVVEPAHARAAGAVSNTVGPGAWQAECCAGGGHGQATALASTVDPVDGRGAVLAESGERVTRGSADAAPPRSDEVEEPSPGAQRQLGEPQPRDLYE